MEQNDKNLQGIYNTLKKEGYNPPAYDQFVTDMRDDKNLQGVRNTLVKHGYTPPEFAEFKADMFGVSPQTTSTQAPTEESQVQATATATPTSTPTSTPTPTEEPVQASVQSAPQQSAWQPTEQDEIRHSYQMHTMLNDFNQRSKERIAQIQRKAEPFTAEGRRKRKAMEFQTQLAGTPTKVMGLTPPTSAPSPDGAQGDVEEAAQPQPVQSGQSPVPYGVKYIDGKPVTQWLLPDGRLTTSFMEADQAEYGASMARLRHQFENRMKQNGLDPAKEDDVRRQAQLEYEAPMRSVLDSVWAKAEAEDRAADEEYTRQVKESNKGFSLSAFGGPDGMPLQQPEGVLRDYNRHIKRKETFDLEKMAQTIYANIPDSYRQQQLQAYTSYFNEHPDELKGKSLQQAATEALQSEIYYAVYQRALDARMPKSKTEFFIRKIADQPFISQDWWLDKIAAQHTGSWGMNLADVEAMAKYGEQHRALDIFGTIANMTLDPTTYVSGAIGSAAGKQALKVGGKMMIKNAAKDVAERYARSTLTGRIVAGGVGGAFNFATYEGLKNAQGQIAVGGYINPETGENEGFSAEQVLKAGAHGLVLGGVVGTFSPILGNIADKYVKKATSTGSKIGIRTGEVVMSTLAEGTIFATPEWIENSMREEGDPNKRGIFDIWTDNMAMMLGFKASHGIKSAPRVIASLRPIKPTNGRPLTQAERNHNRMSFEERVRRNLDASPSNLSFTADEREELRRAGYGKLADLFSRDRAQDVKRSNINPAEGAIELRAERVEPETVHRSPEFDGYSAMEELMQDGRVSQAARAKAYYILTGRMLPMGTVTGYTKTINEDGRVTINATTANGEVVTSRAFKNEQEAKPEIDKVMRQAELNSVDVGERYKEAVADDMVLDAAISEVSPGVDPATIKKIYRAVKSGNKEVTESQKQLVKFLDDAMERNRDIADSYRPEAIREALKGETGIDVDVALRKLPSKRTEAEQSAVKSYLERLFPEEARQQAAEPTPEQAEAQKHYEQGRELFGRFEEGDPTVQAEVDAIALRMQEAYQAVEDAFGSEAKYYMFYVNEHPWALVDDPELTFEQKDAVLYYINAKAALDGVMDASNEVADRKRSEVEGSVAKRTHKDNGVIIPATMKVDGRQVYIVKGDVVMFPDGSAVDVRNSSESVVIMDAQTGEYKFTSPDQINKVSEAVNPQEELDIALSVIEQEQMNIFGDNAVAPEEPAKGAESQHSSGAPTTDNIIIPIDPEIKPDENGVINIPSPGTAEVDAMLAPEESKQTALSRIPVDEHGEPRFEAVDKETAWDGLVEAVGGEADAADIAMAQVQQATTDLEALKKKQPTLKAPKLEGSPMAMAQAKREAAEQYQRELSQYNQQIDEVQSRIDTWNGIAGVYNSRNAELRRQQEEGRRQRDAIAHDEAVARFEEEQRNKAEKQVEQERIGVHAVNPKIKDKWDATPKVEGNSDAITLPDGSTLTGRYVLTEAGAASASHDANNAYQPTEGFPIDENGQSVNDRDYLRDKDAQQKVEDMAGKYDNRALQDPVIVSKEGVVLSGNNRTMSGDLAAGRGTDKAYIGYLREFGHKKYGFTAEQVAGMKNPRVVFVPDEALPYDATTFARFNAQDKKSQGKPEAAVKLGKIVPDNVFNDIVGDISRYDRLSDYYADEKSVAHALGALMQAGVINDMQMPEMRTGTALSAAGKELIENTLIGKVFQASPDAVRKVISMPRLRQSIVMGLSEIATNRTLARNGYDISDELAKAVDLVARAKAALPEVFADGMPVSPFGRMQGLFDDEFGDSMVTDATTLLLADILNSGRPGDLRKILAVYNAPASEAAGGQADIFTGSVPSKEEILTNVKELFKNGTAKEKQELVESAIAKRKERAQLQQRGGGETMEQAASADAGGEASADGAGIDNSNKERKNIQNAVRTIDPRDMSDEERSMRGERLIMADAIDVAEGLITRTEELTARQSAEKWWDDNIGEPAYYSTEAGEVEINRGSIENSLAHRYGQMKLDAITSLIDGFENAVYLGTMPDSIRQDGVKNHYFAYPINYKGERCYVFCRAMQDANKNRLYVHEVFVGEKIKEGDTLQTAASQPHGGIALYRDILANVLEAHNRHTTAKQSAEAVEGLPDSPLNGTNEPVRMDFPAKTSDSKDNASLFDKQEKGEESSFSGEVNLEPTEAQKAAGNYKMEHRRVDRKGAVQEERLTKEEASGIIAEMEEKAIVAPEIELTIENWDAQFGNDGIVSTPIGNVKMGENQFTKLMRQGRNGKLGMIKPTLETPDIIIEDASEAKDAAATERESSYVFVKTFVKPDGARYYYFTSVTVSKDGHEVVISNQEKRRNVLMNLLMKGKLVWKHADDASSASDVADGLFSPQGNMSDPVSEGTDAPQTNASDRKVNALSADKQAESAESSEPYTITATTYTNKKGKTSDVHLVKFNRELTAEEKAALDTFAREPLTEGRKTSRGWYDRKQGGYMMRSEEAARQLAEMIGNEESVADAQPMTAKELREAVAPAENKPAQKPKKAPINRVSLEDIMTDLSTKGETKLSDHAEPVKAEPEAQHEISDNEMQSLLGEIRDILGIGEDEGDTNIKFRDPGELTPQERMKLQSAGIRVAMGLISRGTTAFPDYATKMVGLLGDKIRPWLKSFYEGARWTPGYEKYAFTPSEQVAVFDVQNFDKKQADPIAQAAMIVEERKASTASAQAQKELTETRNKNRRENDKQTEADTAALAEKAEAVAGEAEVTVQSAGTGETGRKRILRDLKRVDYTLDEVNDQLALLGYYEADLDSPEHEVYGLRRSAEKKAVKDAVRLAKQLVDDLGIDIDKVAGMTTEQSQKSRGKNDTAVRANIASVGGDITINLPYPDGRNLHINIGLSPIRERGVESKRGGGAWEGDNYEVGRIMFRFGDSHNHFLPADVTYGKMLEEIESASRRGKPKKQETPKSEEAYYGTVTLKDGREAVIIAANHVQNIGEPSRLSDYIVGVKGEPGTIKITPDEIAHAGSPTAEDRDSFPDVNDKEAVSKWLEDNSAAIWEGVDAIMLDARQDENLLNTFRADNSEWIQESVVGEFVDNWISERLEEMMNEHPATVKAWFDYGQRGIMADVIAERMTKAVTEEAAKAKAEESHNGYKRGDEVMWDRYGDGKWEKQTIVDFEKDGSPIFDSMGMGMMMEVGDWSRIKPADGIFGEAQRVVRKTAEDKQARAERANAVSVLKGGKKPAKKKGSVKPEQPVADLFGGLFAEQSVSDDKFDKSISNEKKTNLQPRSGTAERERGHEPQPNGPLGESQRNEVKGTDGRGMGGRSSVNPMSDQERGGGVPRKPKSQPVAERAPESERKNVRNNHAERGVDYAPKGEDARIRANIEAIELAKRLLDAGETATPEQMVVLRKFSGWGGLGKAFNEQGYTPNPIAKRLRELLGEDGYQDAVDSRRSAYYTPAEVIDTMWNVAKAMGFKGGNVLEGSAGIGNILGLMPSELSDRSSIHAVEIDSTTGGILSLLYPDAKVEIQGFEKTRVQNGSIDLAITNVPFITGAKVFDETGDKDLSKKFHDIHDFCIAKNIRKLREGGIGIFITSSGTMDNSKELRRWIINGGNADVVGAFRMHNKTFGGAGATSDIIVVRKRVNGKPSPNAIDVTDVTGVRVADYDTGDTRKVKGQEIPIIKQYSMMYNKYFAEHPENMAGEMMFNFERGETRFPTSRALFPVKGKEQSEMLTAWAERFADMEEEAATPKVEDEVTRINEQLGEGVKEGSMVLNSQGELCMARMGEAVPIMSPQADKGKPQRTEAERLALFQDKKVKGHTKAECFKAYSAIKKALSDVLEYQSTHEDNEGLTPLLEELNRAFDAFTRTYGNLHKNTAISFLRNDVDFSSILALETYSEKGDKKGNKVVKVGKTDIFSRRVIETEKEPQPTTIKDGILASLYKNGGVDVDYIGQALGKSTEDVKREIVESGLGFENPSTGTMEVSYKYLSGNVREKLHIAQENNADGKYDANIKALEDVMPMTIPAHLIEFSLGSSWIEPKLYEDFVFEKTGIQVKLTNVGGTWFMKTPWRTFNEKNRSMAVVSKMCDKTIMGHELIESAITNKQITVSKTVKHHDGTTETITDKSATAECGTKVDEIRAEFKEWAREHMQADPEMSARIEQTYNDQFNNYAPMSIPDDFVPQHFGGQVSELHGRPFALRPHQGRAVVRGTTESVLLAHEVGTGKTYTLITTAMEMRRLGTARKPMIVVQNATVGQFVESAKEIYPNAKVLTVEEADRNAEGRKNFYAKIKYNDWDMIVVPQSVFERIPDSEEREMAYVKDIIEEKMKVLDAMREADSDGRSMIVRQAEKELAEQEARLAELTETMQGKKKKRDEKREATTRQNAEVRALEMLDREVDDVENFDDMGIDALLVDEAHEYKHLGFSTAMQRGVKGVDPSYSKKAQGVFLKAQAVMERNNGRNVVFATGTPISNTAAEIWTFMRYLMPVDTMKSYGIYYFDDFVRNFGNIAQMVEFSTNGKFKENNRFAGYVNLPELVRIWSSVADTVLTRDAGGVSDKIPDMEGGKPQDIYLPQTRGLRSVMKYVKSELDRFEKMSGKEKKENRHISLSMYGISKAAAVDVRLVVPNAEDDPNSKTNATVRETLRSLKDSAKYKGTVAIFSDNYKNKQSGFNLYEEIRNKLIADGVPAEQTVVIKPGMTVKRKLNIFEKVNAGEIRVIMGSTFTLGTGVNIQERLHTLIHVDAPNRPMDYTQRNGRALRQGNLHKDMGIPVRIIRFGVEDSLDVTAYQRLKTKGAIADSIMNGSKMMENPMEDRVLEEEEDYFGDMIAQLSGSEYAILKNQAEREVRSLTAKQKGHDIDQIYVHNQLPKVEGFIKGAEHRIALETKNLEIIGKHFPDGSIKKITIGKLTFDSVEAMEDFFKEQNAKMNEAAEAIRKGSDNYTNKLAVDVDGLKFEVTTTVSRTIDNNGQGTLTFEPERNVKYSCEALGIKDQAIKGNRLKNVMQKIAEDIVTGRDSRELLSRGQQQLAHYTEERAQLEQRNGREFPYKQELAEAKERLAKYEDAMKKELAEKEAKYAEMDKSVEAASDVTLTEEDSTDSTDTPTNGDGNKYRLVEDSAVLDFLEGQPLKSGFRYAQWANMGVLPPMTAKKDGEWRPPMIFSRWEQSEEGMRKENGKADLVQGNGRTTDDVAYNPYFHIRTSPLNDQFTAAYDRPELLVVEGYYPESEETSGYQAEGAKDSVGLMDWHSGSVNGQLSDDTKVQTMLSRYFKPGRIVPWSEVADLIMERVGNQKITFPINAVPPMLRAELAKRGAKFGDVSGTVAKADIPMLNELRDRVNAGEWDAGLEKARAYLDAYESSTEAKEARVADLSQRTNTPIRIVKTREEAEALPTRRERRAKGWWSAKDDEVVIVLPNNVNVADVDNTFVHEVVGHKGMRAFIGEERFDEFLGEIYDHASNSIRKVIDKMTDKMVDEEADRLRVRKAQAHERAGEDVNANYYTDMAEARMEAEKKREEFRKEATEEYMSDLGGRIGSEGFEKMSRDELTLWGKIKAKVQAFLDKFLQGLKIAKSIRLNDKDLSYILFKSWKNLREKHGKGGVFADAEDAVMRRRTGWDDVMLSESAKVEDANNRFNRQMQRYINGNMTTKEYVEVGKPLGVMKLFLSDVPIVVRQRILHKANATKHNIDLHQLHNLPGMLAEPIFVFQRDSKTLGVLTELRDRKGKNVCVAIELNRSIQSGAEFLEVNDIRSLHGRDVSNIVLPIAHNKTLQYVDKKKGLAWLSSASSNYQQEIAKQDLDSATKIIKDFDNPTFEENETVRFRDGADYVERNPVMARAMYEKQLQTSMYQFTEAMQDSMQGLMEFYKAVESQGGKRDIEDVSSFENAYIAENLMSSKNQAEMNEYERRIMRPLLDIAARMSVDPKGREALTDYMMAKHGLERNAYMRNEAANAGEETERDFAGLCGLTGEQDWQAAEVAAQQIVDDYERAHSADIAELWSAVNTATKASLKKAYDCGLLSKEQYEKIRDMYDYYIPLRGFDEKTSDDVYGYLTNKGGAFSSPIMKAEGRKSKADDPLATIPYMAQNSIIQGNRNVMKQKFLAYVQNHPSDLASVNKLWLVYDATTDIWKPVFADVDETMSPSEIDKAVMDFEERMKLLSQSEPDKYKRGRDAVGIPYRIVDGNIKEHQVVVKRNGESFVITINGNPRAAQAVNGLTNPDNDLNGAIGKVLNAASTVNRQLSQLYTTRNPEFVAANFLRDLIYSNTIVHVKENQSYAMKFHKNHAKVNPLRMIRLLELYEADRLNMHDPIHRMFYEFMHWGGETGYTMQRDLEQEKNLVAKVMEETRRGPLNPMSTFSLVCEKLDQVNRGVENSARFAAFITSREIGRDVQRSAYDAKEITVNFNKKGAGSKFVDAKGQTPVGKIAGFASELGRSFYVFWNAAVQGVANYGKPFKKHSIKALTATTSLLLLGYIMTALNDDGDDVDKSSYYNMPKYTRRSNLMFRTGEQWLTIPLPIEYRALYGLGELAYSVTSGREEYSDAELAKETASQLSQLLPIDFMEGGGGLHAFIPSAFKPMVESAINTSWTGLPLYKDTPFNKDMPEWTKAYPRTNSQLVELSKWANEASGGNDYKAGWANFNPAQLEYLLNGYLGGYSNVINKMLKTGEIMFGERDYDPSNILIVNRLVKMGDERTAEKKINSDFFQHLEDYKRTHALLRKYEDEAERGSDKYRIFLDALKHSRDGARHNVMDEYISDYNWLHKTIKDPGITEEERIMYEEDMLRLKREVVSLMKVATDSVQMNRLREQFAQEDTQQ